ncbi:putative beta-lactamase family protein [Diaporthe ampelina]|uniref:Putative beta-lactamase family protein n=1 Tax=Diaporthe ampelina TaxID=1214573 RepID=A0A0G2FLS1_9PEZI|nr:putative beta-lactamase family protein [Diaporthe ampelina]
MPCSLRVSWTLLAATPVAASLYTQPCPLYGQNYPAPTGLATSKHVEAAAESVLDQLLKAKNGTTSYGPLDTDTTAFSVDFYSLESEGTLFSHHYTPAQLLGQRTVGVEEVDSDTIYRVGSVSKLWTVYLYLIAAGDQSWNEPITKFIPELHELVQGQEPDPTKFFADFPTQHPVVASYETPVYSNTAFQILGYALENITGKLMHELFSQHLVAPLNLTSTSYHPPPTPDTSIVPYNTSISWWFADLLDLTPAGGYFSTANDMRKVGKAILGSTQLDPAVTRRWMKPHSFLSNRDAAAGAPWEIYRAPGEPTITMMTKAGDLGMYSSYVVLVPELKVGLTVLSAGGSASDNTRILGDILVDAFVPAVRAAAADEAAEVYAGTFSADAAGSSITLVSEGDEAGLSLEQWSFGGQDVLALLGRLKGANITARMYYSGLEAETPNGTVSSWRAVYQAVARAVGPGPLSPICDSWFTVDGLTYGGVGLDEFLVTTVDGKAISIEPRVLGVPMSRAD